MKKRKHYELTTTPVWRKTETGLELTSFFRDWWEQVSIQRYGDKEHCLEVAAELGYLWQHPNPNGGNFEYEPVGFDYDPAQYRISMNISEGMPLVRQDECRHAEYQQLWKRLLSENKEVKINGE